MKHLLISLLLVLPTPYLHGQVFELYEVPWEIFNDNQVEEVRQKITLKRRKENIALLKQAKEYLINGDIKKSKFYLQKIDDEILAMKLVRDRYMAQILFIEGNYEEALKILKQPFYNNPEHYKHICLMRVLTKLIVKDLKDIKLDYTQCAAVTERYTQNEHIWYDTLYYLNVPEGDKIVDKNIYEWSRNLDNLEIVRLWLKLSLYNTKDTHIERHLPTLPGFAYGSNRLRELIGLAYYRTGNDEMALKFVEDLHTANAENIKGNLNLAKDKYELAFGHYRLALKEKENSTNALERALPLSWKLKMWEEGLGLLSNLVNKDVDVKKKLSLNTAFQIQLGNYKRARSQFNLLKSMFRSDLPKEVNMMGAYSFLMLGDGEKLEDQSLRACQKYDGLNCYSLFQQKRWENLSKTIKREERINFDDEFSLAALKESSSVSGIEETLIVDQRDIEELDSDEVKLQMPENTDQ